MKMTTVTIPRYDRWLAKNKNVRPPGWSSKLAKPP